ncbi:sulfurtransferase [Thiomicrorhabdus sp. HH1]|uniref:Sulfurtransferase n=2 Tax=Piscirickettsiaceae TaxID=135616 RepID=A0ABS0BY98_9GAMM|nr:sulfurtransferase [Thiomicrorhabdus heinhorstiae]
MAFSSSVSAVEPSKWATPAPTQADRHSPQELYIDAANTYKWMKEDDSVILVDVRTPEEWQFVGYTPMAQIMIPSVFFRYDAVDAKKPRYSSKLNENFISEFEEKLFDLGADKDSTYVIMCRSGATRAQPAAKMLDQYGYKNVYIMTDGFEGGKVKDGERKGWRLSKGWKVNNPTDSWTYKIDTKNTFLMKY